ncbi:hypothetical protein BSKO_04295 [Bryopsis sp. KO-2023]|nr:hypothetical protein BSKO_04295 [Bryopsis sp. KO-2023]
MKFLERFVGVCLGVSDEMAISRVVGSLALVPASIAWALGGSLPTAVLYALGQVAATGFIVSLAATDFAAKKTTGLLGKGNTGKVGLWSCCVFWPYHLGLRVKLWWRRTHSAEPLFHEIIPGWFLGGWPKNASSLPPGNPSVMDVTCELPRTHNVGSYLCLPTWDTHGPTTSMIEEGVEWAFKEKESGAPIYIHCAHGHGRSATILCACLIKDGQASTMEEAIAISKAKRPKVKMNRRQRQVLQDWLDLRKKEEASG